MTGTSTSHFGELLGFVDSPQATALAWLRPVDAFIFHKQERDVAARQVAK